MREHSEYCLNDTPFFVAPGEEIYFGGAAGPAAVGRRVILALGGEPPEPAWFARLASGCAADIWGVDAGIDTCLGVGLAPGLIIGDNDSASDGAWHEAARLGAEEHGFDAAKDLTDFQLAIKLAEARGVSEAVVTGCFGGRFDHLMSVIESAASSPLTLLLADGREGMIFIKPAAGIASARVVFNVPPLAISLLSISDVCREVCIDGARWPLDGAELSRGWPWAISNELAVGSREVSVASSSGVLALYWRAGGGTGRSARR